MSERDLFGSLRIDRRAFLKRAGAASLFLAGGSVVAACGGGSNGGGGGGGETAAATTSAAGGGTTASTGASGTVTLLTPAGPRFGDAHKAVAELFMEQQSEIKVEIEDIPLNDLYTKEGAALGSGSSSFNAMILDPNFIPSVATKLTPIKEFVDNDPEYKADIEAAVPEAIRTYPSYGNEVYGFPTDANCQLMWYRADLLDAEGVAPPETWDDALEIAKSFTRDTAEGKQYGFTTNLAKSPFAGLTFGAIMNCYGRVMQDPETLEPQLETEEAITAMTMLVELMKYADPGSKNAGDNETVQAIATGTAVCAPVAWTTNGFQNKEVNQFADVTMAAKVPKGTGPNAAHAPWLGGLFYGIPAASEDQEASAEFAKFLSSADAMKTFVENTGQPARTDALQEYSSIWPYFSALAEQLPTTIPFIRIPEWFSMLDPLGAEVFAAVDGSKSPEQACADANAAWTKILNDAGYFD